MRLSNINEDKFNKQALIDWLVKNNGVSIHRFEVGDDSRQIADARNFAESMRAKLGNFDPDINIEQIYNKVTISLKDIVPAPVG